MLLSFLIFGFRSLAGIEEVPADTDAPEQVETKGEGEEVNEMQQQNVAEEVQSIQGSEGRKVRRKKDFLFKISEFNVMFSFLLCLYLTECIQSTVKDKQCPACRGTREPSANTD